MFEAGYSTADEGTGVGLRIVERVAEAHGWKVRVTDGEGGARFEVTGVEFVYPGCTFGRLLVPVPSVYRRQCDLVAEDARETLERFVDFPGKQ